MNLHNIDACTWTCFNECPSARELKTAREPLRRDHVPESCIIHPRGKSADPAPARLDPRTGPDAHYAHGGIDWPPS